MRDEKKYVEEKNKIWIKIGGKITGLVGQYEIFAAMAQILHFLVNKHANFAALANIPLLLSLRIFRINLALSLRTSECMTIINDYWNIGKYWKNKVYITNKLLLLVKEVVL